MNRIPLLLTLTIVSGFAQTKPAFDAASIKPSASDGFAMRTMIGSGLNGRFSSQGLTARALILQAYGMQDFQVSGGPSWITTDRFDIEATPGTGVAPTQEQSRQMLQTLLEERFQLKVRKESKAMAAYNLTATKSGPKLKASSIQPGNNPGSPGGGMMRMAPGNLSGQSMTMEMFVRMISNQVGRPITDKTGLTGAYDIDLLWTPDRMPTNINVPPGVQLPPIDPNGPDLFTALQEQLGLRLEATTQAGQALIIERIEKPSEN